jgi:hypothetical protein
MHRPKRPLLLALVALGLCAGTGIPVAMRERGYWADKPWPQRPLASRFTPADAMRLRPGQFRWAPYPDDGAPVNVAIDLTNQRAFVFQGRALIGIAAISSGRRGHGTPTGTFPILEKARFHRSTLYSDAPMPFMQRLTWGGIALHAGYNPGRPASHGCIRLPYGFARLLFRATSVGGIVTVTRGDPLAAPPPLPTPEIVDAGPPAGPVVMASVDQAPAPAPGQARMLSTEQSVALMSSTTL